MSISLDLIVERSDELELALRRIEGDPAFISGAFAAVGFRYVERQQEGASAEVGFSATGCITMRLVNSRSLEATDGIVRGSLAAARLLRGSTALYVELDSRIFRRMNGVLEYYPASGKWNEERLTWIRDDNPVLVPIDANYPPEAHRAWRASDSSGEWYEIERLDGTEVIRVSSVNVVDRTLVVRYDMRNTRMLYPTAQVLILTKVLHELLQDAYRSQVDRIEFHSPHTDEPQYLPYA